MKKQLIACAVTVGLAVAANASSEQLVAKSNDSLAGSLQSIGGILSSGKASLSVVKDGSLQLVNSVESAASAVSDGVVSSAVGVGNASVWILTTTPLDQSRASGTASADSAEYVVTTSGDIYVSVGTSLVKAVTEPIASSGKVATSVEGSVRYTVNSAGQIMTASGTYAKDKFGEPAQAVMTGSGNVFVASGQTVVISGNAVIESGKSTLTFLDETVVESVKVAGSESGKLIRAASASVGRVFNAAKRGRLND